MMISDARTFKNTLSDEDDKNLIGRDFLFLLFFVSQHLVMVSIDHISSTGFENYKDPKTRTNLVSR